MAMKYDRAVDKLRMGSVLMRQHVREGNRLLTKWFVHPGGEVTEDVVKKLMKQGCIKPSKDGLWPGLDQTWRFS